MIARPLSLAFRFSLLALLTICSYSGSVAQDVVAVPKLIQIPAGRFLMGGQVPAEQVASDFAAYG